MNQATRTQEQIQFQEDIQSGLASYHSITLEESRLNLIEQLFPGTATHAHPVHAINDQDYIAWLNSFGATIDNSLLKIRSIK